jgi:hypothetical protein
MARICQIAHIHNHIPVILPNEFTGCSICPGPWVHINPPFYLAAILYKEHKIVKDWIVFILKIKNKTGTHSTLYWHGIHSTFLYQTYDVSSSMLVTSWVVDGVKCACVHVRQIIRVGIEPGKRSGRASWPLFAWRACKSWLLGPGP